VTFQLSLKTAVAVRTRVSSRGTGNGKGSLGDSDAGFHGAAKGWISIDKINAIQNRNQKLKTK